MRKIYFALLILSTGLALAQNPIPNPGFENWTTGDPDGWDTPNFFSLTPVTQSGDAQSGASAVRLEVIDDDGSPYPPIINTNSLAISQNYLVFSFYSKTSLTNGDALVASVILEKNGTPVSINNFSITANTNVYTQRSYTLSYTQPVSGVADELTVQLGIAGSMLIANVGSYALVDGLSISGNLTATGIEESGIAPENSIGNPQPNPGHDLTLVPFSLAAKTKAVIDLLTLDGKLVREILNEELAPGNYKAECRVDDLPAGLYLLRLNAAGSSNYSKILVQ